MDYLLPFAAAAQKVGKPLLTTLSIAGIDKDTTKCFRRGLRPTNLQLKNFNKALNDDLPEEKRTYVVYAPSGLELMTTDKVPEGLNDVKMETSTTESDEKQTREVSEKPEVVKEVERKRSAVRGAKPSQSEEKVVKAADGFMEPPVVEDPNAEKEKAIAEKPVRQSKEVVKAENKNIVKGVASASNEKEKERKAMNEKEHKETISEKASVENETAKNGKMTVKKEKKEAEGSAKITGKDNVVNDAQNDVVSDPGSRKKPKVVKKVTVEDLQKQVVVLGELLNDLEVGPELTQKQKELMDATVGLNEKGMQMLIDMAKMIK
jgi:hypothetical protein